MTLIQRLLLFCVVQLINSAHSQYLEEYDRCTAENDRCTDLRSCPSLEEPMMNGFIPKYCKNGSHPIVCCTTKEQGPPDRRRWKLSKSEMMCLIYLEDVCTSTRMSAVGGSPAAAKELPFMARIGYSAGRGRIRWSCAGTLISTNFVLSAAHCTFYRGVRAKWARLGELDTSTETDDARPENFAIVETINHKKYLRHRRYHDIALYRLEKHVVFNEYIQPICLYQSDSLSRYKTVNAAGWGRTDSGRMSKKLMKVKLSLYDIDTCKNLENFNRMPFGLLDESQICSGAIEGKRDTCSGDSGGPLYLPSKNKNLGRCVLYRQIGITSFGESTCGRRGYAAIYTKISAYRKWIEAIVWRDLPKTWN